MPYNCINKAYFLLFNGNEAYVTDWLIKYNTLIPLLTKQEGQMVGAGCQWLGVGGSHPSCVLAEALASQGEG